MELDERLLRQWHDLGETLSERDGVQVFSSSGYESNVCLLLFKIVEHLAERAVDGIIVAETGCVVGTFAKRVVDYLTINDVAWFFCPDMDLRNLLLGDAFFLDNLQACMKNHDMLDPVYAASIDLLVLNSAEPIAWGELAIWIAAGKKDSYLVIPRTTPKVRRMLDLLQVPGQFLGNPAQTFVARKNHPIPRQVTELWSGLLERTAEPGLV